MTVRLIPILAVLLGVLAASAAQADPCDAPGLRNTPGAYDRCVQEWYGRSNSSGPSAADQAMRQYLNNLEREAEEERLRRAEEARKAAANPRPFVRGPEYEGETKLRVEAQQYQDYRNAEFKRIAAKFRSLDYGFEKPEAGADGYYYPIWMTVPFAGEMMVWAEKGYKKYPAEMESLYGFMIAADPCADNPNQVGFPLSNDLDLGNTFYEHLNRHPECTYGRMYRAIPHLLAAQKSTFPPHRALACAQIEAWIAHYFDNGTPVQEPIFFQGAVYNDGDYRYLNDKLAQCRAGLPHAAAFDRGLVQPAREWVKRTGNYFADVRLVRFYDRKVWEQAGDFEDPDRIRAVFDEVIKDYDTVTRAHPAIFTRGIDQRGGGWQAYR